MPGHPGVVTSIDPLTHVLVAWLGLESEPVSWGVGHNPDNMGRYPHLGLVADDEWEAAARHGWWAERR